MEHINLKDNRDSQTRAAIIFDQIICKRLVVCSDLYIVTKSVESRQKQAINLVHVSSDFGFSSATDTYNLPRIFEEKSGLHRVPLYKQPKLNL